MQTSLSGTSEICYKARLDTLGWVSMIKFQGVGMRYGFGPEILHGLNFELAPGSFHFLTGPSGAGKSSLLKLLYLAHLPSSGRMTMFERDVTKVAREELPLMRRQIGVVFQDFRLLDHLTALDNVALPLRIAGYRENDIRKHVVELLSWVGLGARLDATPPSLSGGEQQRVAIARAVIARPTLLLADEPTGNVDDEMAIRLIHLFVELNRVGTTVLIATHDHFLIERMRRPVLRIVEGTVTQDPPLS